MMLITSERQTELTDFLCCKFNGAQVTPSVNFGKDLASCGLYGNAYINC